MVTFFSFFWKPTDEDNISKPINMPLGPLISIELVTKKFMNNIILISDSSGKSKQYFLISVDLFIHIHKFKPNMQN